jgi:diacylglycerol kinase family enzyme
VDSVLIFANPIAGRGKGRRIAGRLEKRLRAEGFEVRTVLDRPDQMDPAILARPAMAAIVIGGDGTLRGVAEHLFLDGPMRSLTSASAPHLLSSEASTPTPLSPPPAPPLLIIPLGTANLMGRHLGIRWNSADLEGQVVRAIRKHEVVHLDAGGVNGKLFLLMAGVGFDAHVVHELARVRRGPINYASYAIPAALAITGYAYPELRVTVDGREVFSAQPAVAFVGNVAEYGTGFPILPHARPDDELLDVCVLPCRSRNDLFRLFLQAAVGEHLNSEGAVYVKGRSARVESAVPVPVQVDGDSAGHTPIDVELLPVRVPFIVPQQ